MSEVFKRIFHRQLTVSNILLGILAVSSIVRVGAAVFLGDSVRALPGIADQETYHVLAQRLLGGHGFTFATPWWPATRAGEPTAHWSYLYTYYLSGVYALFGVSPLVARILQALIVGFCQPYLAYKLGKRLFGSTPGLIAAAVMAFYAYFVYYAAALMTEAFFITALMGILYIAIRITDYPLEQTDPLPRSLWINTLALGVTISAAILFRQLIGLFVPFLFLWLGMVLRSKIGTKRTILIISAATLIVVLAILPFSINNYDRFGTFVLLNTNAGFAFFWANHPIHGTHFQPILSGESASYGDLIPRSMAALNEAELDKALLKLGLGFVVDDPVRYGLLSLSRIPAYFQFWPASDSSLPSNVLRVMSFGIMLPFMLYGLYKAIKSQRKLIDLLGSPIGLLLVFMVVYTGVHILSWSLVRYRLPVDAFLIPFAGYGIYDLAVSLTGSTVIVRNKAVR